MIFNEVYGSYYNVVAAVLLEATKGMLTKDRIYEIVNEKAFGESITTIPDALLSGRWPLINEDMDTPIMDVPTMPLTTLQKMWLKAVLLDPRVQLFDVNMDGLDDVKPLYQQGEVVFFDRYADGDPYDDQIYKDNFKAGLSAIKEKRRLWVAFYGKHGVQRIRMIPEKYEYSAKDDKFRLIGHTVKGKEMQINMARVSNCIIEDAYTEEELSAFKKRYGKKRQVIFELYDARNALERVMLAFSDLEKETIKLDDKNYRIKLIYRADDETEVLIRIMSFGPMVKVTEPEQFIELIKERVFKQKVAK